MNGEEALSTSASWVAVIELERASSPFMRVIEVCSSVTRSTSATSAMVKYWPAVLVPPGTFRQVPRGLGRSRTCPGQLRVGRIGVALLYRRGNQSRCHHQPAAWCDHRRRYLTAW